MNKKTFEKISSTSNIFDLDYKFSDFSILMEKTIFNMKLKYLYYKTYHRIIPIRFEEMYDVYLEIFPFNDIIYSFKLELNKYQHPIIDYINGIYERYIIWFEEFVNIRLFKFNNKVLKL